jgi:glycosyltransferase involved in cell wall biosynthesis
MTDDERPKTKDESKPMRRVLMVTPRYLPLMGGIETHVYEVARRFARAGLDVTVLTTDRTGKLPRVEASEGVQIRRVRAYPAQWDIYFAPALYREITRGAWDIVHCQGIHTLVAPLAMFAAWRAKIPYVVTFHTGGHSSAWRNAVRGIQWRALRPLLARAQRLIGVSQFEADLFQRQLGLPREKFSVIPNGGSLPPKPSDAPTSDDAPLIISVGRLEKYKGHHRIIRALSNILAEYPRARLLVLGTGPYEDDLRQLARACGVAERVEIRAVPATDRAQMAATLARASLIVLLSEYEAHPIAVMESLALGRPVLVADTSGLSELAARGLVRAIPLHASSEEIAAAVLAQLREPLIPTAVQLPTWEECAEKILIEYRRAFRPHRSPRPVRSPTSK